MSRCPRRKLGTCCFIHCVICKVAVNASIPYRSPLAPVCASSGHGMIRLYSAGSSVATWPSEQVAHLNRYSTVGLS